MHESMDQKSYFSNCSPKNENLLKMHSDVNEFVSSSQQIWRNLALHHLLTMDPLQWMGATKLWVQTADKNITIVIHKTPVQITSCEVKNDVFGRNKSIIKMFELQNVASTTHTSPLSIILLSPVKNSSNLNQERKMQRSKTVFKQFKTV